MMMGNVFSTTATDTIPFTYSATGHIVIQVKVQGSNNTYPFFLDTGASNIIFSSHQNEFKLKRNGFGVGLGANKNLLFSKIYKCDSAQIGSFKFKNINTEEININADCIEEICGIIGTGIMHHLDWQIDFEKMQIIITDSTNQLKIKDNAISIPLYKNKFSSHLKTKIKFGNSKKSHSVLIDIGNGGLLNFSEDIILNDSIPFNYKKVFGTNSNSLGNDKFTKSEDKIYLADNLYFNESTYSVTNIPIRTAPKSLNMLGLDFLKKYKTTISYKTNQLLLEPYKTEQQFIWETCGFILKFDKESGKAIIENVIENTSAYCENIPLNAEVLSINNYLFRDRKSYCNYKSQNNADENVELTLRNNGVIEKYYLIRAPIFE